MALFVKKPMTESSTPLFTLHADASVVLVGLGNPGKEYDNTRHNIGFACLDSFASANDFPSWIEKRDLKCQIITGRLGPNRVILVKPQTFMNLSGEAVRAVLDFYKVGADKTIVVHDELDIDFGQIRTKIGGSAAGHNGVKSVIQHLGEDFGRVRIGIGPKRPEQIDSADFVLQTFSTDEQAQQKDLTTEVNAVLTEYIFGGQTLQSETRSFLI